MTPPTTLMPWTMPMEEPPRALSVPHFTKTGDGYVFAIRVLQYLEEASYTVYRSWDSLLEFSQRLSEAFPLVEHSWDPQPRPLPKLQRKMSLFITRSTMQSRRDELDIWLRRIMDTPLFIRSSTLFLTYFADDAATPPARTTLAVPATPSRPMMRTKHSVPDLRFTPAHDPDATVRVPQAARRRPQLDTLRVNSDVPQMAMRTSSRRDSRAGAASPISSVSSTSSSATIKPPPSLRKFISLQDIRQTVVPPHPVVAGPRPPTPQTPRPPMTPRKRASPPPLPTIPSEPGEYRSRVSSTTSSILISPPLRSREGSLSTMSSNRTSSESERSPRTPPTPAFSFGDSSTRLADSSIDTLDWSRPSSLGKGHDDDLSTPGPLLDRWDHPTSPVSTLSPPLLSPLSLALDMIAVKVRHPATDTIIAIRVPRKFAYAEVVARVADKLGEEAFGLTLAAAASSTAREAVGDVVDDAKWRSIAKSAATKTTLVVVGVAPGTAC